eukprot:TRINITY_DN39706_c0_g1_i1.p1 TRINITY_DN39706_c0_g1~~TRINITY_DN39706_c0_g1_i1.p1  ORF type:complete len:1228 (+),score=202.23 TRINITY_DN39706_c0_g1_i1:159-3842(+)
MGKGPAHLSIVPVGTTVTGTTSKSGEDSPRSHGSGAPMAHLLSSVSATSRRVHGACSGTFMVTIGWDDNSAENRPLRSDQPAREAALDDVFVRNIWLVYPVFARRSDEGGIDMAMEVGFARSKYVQFRWTFAQVSVLMGLGTLGLALFTGLSADLWLRSCILVGLVAPLYFLYCVFVWKTEAVHASICGSWRERLLMYAFCVHSLAIVAAEFTRERLDYGMLVMHIGFIHNFTPMSGGAMHMISIGFCLIPYSLCKLILWLNASDEAGMTITEQPLGSDVDFPVFPCARSAGAASKILEMVVPWVMLLYQVAVTMGRDRSMRLDFLTNDFLQQQRQQLAHEKTKCEDLLSTMLPRRIIGLLKNNEPIEPQLFDDVTVIFVEICDFSSLVTYLSPKVVVEVLNVVYLEFDRLSDLLHVYKVETVGQVYMAVVGCPEPVINHADVAAHFAIAAQESIVHLRKIIADIRLKEHCKSTTSIPLLTHVEELDSGSSDELPRVVSESQFEVVIRVGLHSGGLRAGVVGLDSPRYKLVGDTVNTASRMESTCHPGKIQVSLSTKERLTPGMFSLLDRGEIPVKGKGTMRTYFLDNYTDAQMTQPREVMIEIGDSDPVTDLMASQASIMRGPPALRSTKTQSNSSMSLPMVHEMTSGSRHVLEAWQSPLGTPRVSPRDAAGADMTTSIVSLTGSRRSHRAPSLQAVFDHEAVGLFTRDFSSAQAFQRQKTPRFSQFSPRDVSNYWKRLKLLFLLVPPSQKNSQWMKTLKDDESLFLEATSAQRIQKGRNLTVMWQLFVALLAACDYFMDVLDEDLTRYRKAILFRVLGNNVVGLVYILLTNIPSIAKSHTQVLTCVMLATQGLALLTTGGMIYNGEVAGVAFYISYVLFYSCCTFPQRLSLCAMLVIGFVVLERIRCGWGGVESALNNVSFLLCFLFFMACGVRLEEHLAHVAHYEQRRVAKRLTVIQDAKAAGSQLLDTLLPAHVASLVGQGVSPIAEQHDVVTIIFTDIKGFTAYSSKISPHELVNFLNSMYTAFDEIIVNWQLHKVEIIGDAYFVSAGCPTSQGGDIEPAEYAMRAVEVALNLQRTLPTVCDDAKVMMRVGIHTGSVVAGVVGKKGPRYHLFGPTVTYAEKMESHGIPGKVQISDVTHDLLEHGGYHYQYESRDIEVEGCAGLQKTYLICKASNKQAFQVQKKLLMQRRRSNAGQTAEAALGAAEHAMHSMTMQSGTSAHPP